MNINFYNPTRLLFGQGKLNELHNCELPGKKAMIVISNGKSTRANGYLSRTENELKKAGVNAIVYDKIGPNPLKEAVEQGARVAKNEKCDFIVALGGGSVMDAGKNIAMLATQDNSDLWYYAGGVTGKNNPPDHKPLPWIAITTTAGTGSEVDQWGVITNLDTNEKIACGKSDDLFARIAIVDPELMTSVPPLLTAYQGFDTFFHNAEGYISKHANFMSEMFNRDAITKVWNYLPRAVKDGNDLEARENIAYANTEGGYSMVASSTTGHHALEHAMSAFYPDLPHGAGLILLSKAYFTFCAEHEQYKKRLIDMARLMGKADSTDPMDFVTQMEVLKVKCGVDKIKMSDWGIKKEDLAKMAKNAIATTQRLFVCDRLQFTEQDCIDIYTKSWS